MPRRDTKAMQRNWKRTQRAELQFARALRRVAARCGAITRGSFDTSRPVGSSAQARRALENYGQTLQSWAKATASRMVLDVARRDEKFWIDKSKEIGRNLRAELQKSPTGIAVRERTAEAAALITSLPLEAAQRIERYAVDYMTRGIRASELAQRVMSTGQVTKSRANTIARTETSRTAGLLQEYRAKSVGSEGYIWRTVEDYDVRDRHRRLEGKFFRWDSPPVAGEKGERAHPGGIYNCFSPETLVAPVDGHLSVFRSYYCGPVVILVLGETSLRVTPNHPVLTTIGWKRAENIKEGDDVVNVPFEGLERIEHNVDNGLLSFSEIFEAGSLTRKTTPFPVDGFYGDIVDEHVDIVVPKFYLPSDLKPGILQCLGKEMVSESNSGVFGLAVAGRLPEVIEASFAGLLQDSPSLAFGSALEPELVGSADRALSYSSLSEDTVNDEARAVIAFAESSDPFTSEVLSSDLLGGKIDSLVVSGDFQDTSLPLLSRQALNVEAQRFATDRIGEALASGALSTVRVTGRFLDRFMGHVFTSETASGYYRVSSLGILSKNCRCWAEVVLPGELRRKGTPQRRRAAA